ncbi:RNA polymerase sigma-70 factor [Dyadobacter chenwenxiniae]|uniref:RNA polymerase sigma-70 factor n=1 Tax=Dyadobacter chenwenxiniae TaxID=2906456 RepID=A0A9X1PQH2_9BACT|nr:RNA polymerase sigma-70 factor [Dyadobacter chenwenxiniae]MCF0065565.1 RNA polymerase sigma-70 factor [Dyadobacter chenwenxiniae]UON85476.1 RNA polymerase sigma-70 factor [Dyadobacter chenwenxiniae]
MPETQHSTDIELTHLLKSDDKTAFAEIYRRYAKSLAGFAASKLFNLEDAEDIIHDIFVKLWEDRERLQITSNLKTYLFTLTRHRIIDIIRRNITREEYAAMLQSLANAYQPSIEQKIAAKELQQTIENSLDQLSPRVKDIYQLSREENLSIPEIAEKLQLSEQTVKNQLSTALSHLRKSVSAISVSILLLWWLR